MGSEGAGGGATLRMGEEEAGAQGRLSEVGHLKSSVLSPHLIESVVKEIALEGLEGITFQALKIRLGQGGDFEIEDFEDIAPAIWNQLKFWKGIKFYLLPESRADLVRYRWDEFRDARGCFYEPLHAPEDIYRYFPVEDKQRGIRGSCEHYKARKDITELARKSNYVQIMKGLGNRLAIVASQCVRERILLGPNYRKHQGLTIIQYCIMERVGRSRSYGEITRGKISSVCLNVPPKTQFYMRKHLLKSGLIKRQNTSIKFPGGKCPAGITVFHLPQFYRRIEPVASINTRTIFNWLNSSQSHSIPVEKIIAKFGKHTLRNVTSLLPTLAETTWEQRIVNQEEPIGLEEREEKTGVKTRHVRVLRLLVTDVGIQNQAILEAFEKNSQSREDTTAAEGDDGGDHGNQEEGEEVVSIICASSYSGVKVLRPASRLITSSDCLFLLRSFWRSGLGGLTLLEIGSLMKITPLESRSCSRILTRHKACTEGILKRYKQKAFNYTLVNFSSQALEIHVAVQDKFTQAMMEIERINTCVKEKETKRLKRIKAKIISQKEKKNVIIPEAQISSEQVAVEEVLEDADPLGTLTDSQDVREQMEISSDDANCVISLEAGKQPEVISEQDKSEMTFADAGDLSSSSSTPSDPNNVAAVINSSESVHSQIPGPNVSESANFSEQDILTSIKCDPEDYNEESMGQTSAVVQHEYDTIIADVSVGTAELFVDNEFRSSVRDREDSVDESIRKRMTRQRVSWTATEDRIMLLAFIGSSLFIPKYPYDKIFTFNAVQIRDVMQKRSNRKSNKTTATIRRRIQFLLHQKVHFDWYFQQASQAIRDNHLYENYVKEHLPPPQQKIYLTPPFEPMESAVNYLLSKCDATASVVTINELNGNDVVSVEPAQLRGGLAGIETLQFLRQLKRAEFYWNGMLFLIFCPMGETLQTRRKFYAEWRELVKASSNQSVESSDVPVFEMEEVTEMQMELKEIKSGGENLTSPQDLFLGYCWKFLKFLVKHLNIMFNTILMLGSLPATGFQIVPFDSSVDVGATSNICLSLRECNDQAEVRLWTSRSMILEQILSGGGQSAKEFITTGKKEKLPLEKAARSLNRSRVLVAPKGTDILRLNRTHLKSLLGGLPAYSFDEICDLLRYVDEESKRVDAVTCLSVGIFMGIIELMDYWTARITVAKPVFSVKNPWSPLPSDESADEEGDILVPSDPLRVVKVIPESESGPSEKKPDPSPPLSKGKKRKRSQLNKEDVKEKGSTKKSPGRLVKKKRKKRKVDKIVNEMAECFSDLSVDGGPTKRVSKSTSQSPPPKRNVGLEEGENFLSNSSDHLHLLRIRLHPSTTSSSKSGNPRPSDYVPHTDDQTVSINFPNLEFEFSKKTCGLNHCLVGDSRPFSLDSLKELRRGLMELVYHNVSPSGKTSSTETTSSTPRLEKHLNKYTVIFDMIRIAGEVGVSGAFLDTAFERKSLVNGLRYLLEAKLIFSLGVVHRRFVTYNNVRNWLIPIRPQIRNLTIVGHVIMRPWITAVGGISWTMVDRLFTALVGQLQKPSIKLNELCQLFAPTLSPVEALVLIESLAKLKYLILYKLQEPKVTLFSKHPTDQYDIEYNPDTLIDTENVYVAASPYITTLHAQLHRAIQETSKKKQFTNTNDGTK